MSIKIGFFDTHSFERPYFENALKKYDFELHFLDHKLNSQTVKLAEGYDSVCSFINDRIDKETIDGLKALGVKLIALRSAGFNHVDLEACKAQNLPVTRVPAYSPESVAEHTIALLMTLNRKTHKAYNRVRESNFSLDGLIGFDVHKKTIGVVGTGKIGMAFSKIAIGFGANVIAFDQNPSKKLESLGVSYKSLEDLLSLSDVISLHVPLNEKTKHIINEKAFNKMKDSAVLLNTSRGALVDTKALIKALKLKKIEGAALDVYEEEEKFFFSDHSIDGIDDDDLARLTTFPNVLITAHQGFLTHEALTQISETTLKNIDQYFATGDCDNLV